MFLAELRGKRSCHSGYKGNFAGWEAPVHALKEKSLINSEDDVADFFQGSCVPGAPVRSKLCQQCVGSIAANDDQVSSVTKCKPNNAEAFNGGDGALEYVAKLNYNARGNRGTLDVTIDSNTSLIDRTEYSCSR